MVKQTTPMMEQYNRIKAQHTDSVLFFRLGDFYEMFNDEAIEVSRLLNLTLTRRGGVPMCGIPYHAAKVYIARLLKHGKKIAICEQLNNPPPGQLTERKVIEVITPGTAIEESLLESGQNNYLLGLYCSGKKIRTKHGDDYYCGLAYIDVSTGEFFATHFLKSQALEKFTKEFETLRPNEILMQQSLLAEIKGLGEILAAHSQVVVNYYPDWSFVQESAEKKLCAHFKVQNLKGFGLHADSPEIPVASLLLDYLGETAGSLLNHIIAITLYTDSDFLILDDASRKNLELIANLNDGTSSYTLFEVLNQTKTVLGTRKLREEIFHPLRDAETITAKQDKVEALYTNEKLLAHVRKELAQVLDIQRLLARISMNKANGKDLLSLKQSVSQVLRLVQISREHRSFFLKLKEEEKGELQNIFDVLDKSINDDCTILLTDGKLIKTGWSSELDELKALHDNVQEVLLNYLKEEEEKTGLQRLKIKCNKMHGYFIEVTKFNLSHTPEHFILLKDLKTSKFFTTDKLMDIQERIEHAEEQIKQLEKKLFAELVARILDKIKFLYDIAEQIAYLDVLQSYATTAVSNHWVKPEITTDGTLEITGGRHPVVEYHIPQGKFIPNDLALYSGENLPQDKKTFALITGPNMAGKSTFLRQNALIVLLAQMGSFVPAESARIGVCDKIFCRVGASDNLARGESTFLVEMIETAFILQNAGEKSLIIMDEVGRGTSTEDGLAIAQAVCEYLLNTTKAKTIFATHYHELGALKHKALCNLKLEVANADEKIVFLKKVVPGVSENSYGIHVGKIAGLPRTVTERAQKILQVIVQERRNFDSDVLKVPERAEIPKEAPELFSPSELIINEITSLDINNLRPIDALQLLQLWKNELQEN